MVDIWTLLVSVSLFSAYFVEGSTEVENGICGRMFIRNKPVDLMRLQGCHVIEGSLQIALIGQGTPEKYKNYSFPLREITGYLLIYDVRGIQTLRHIFPNLTVIRGQEYIHNNYALIVYDMQDMQEIGLPSLTHILKGKVWIHNNQNLCYLDTIDWGRITNDTQGNDIKKNKANDQCPNTCPKSCPLNADGDPLCWSNEDCQKDPMKTCSSDCIGRSCDDCCSDQCLGGCTGTGPDSCFVCKNVEYNGRCMSECPAKTYMYLNRRCVTEQECSSMNFSDPSSNKRLVGKKLEDRECVLECPKGYEMVNNNGVESCRKCEGHCKKICSGLMVDSVDASTQLKGCTRIQGSLKIQIRGYTANLATELAANLDMIEEIDDYLVVAYTYSLLSLNFFKSLRFINGKKLEEQTYALVVKSNENIGSLWNETVVIRNKKARVLFHYNPKLCPQKAASDLICVPIQIREFVKASGLTKPKDERADIGVTNGDKVPCNQKKLEVKINKMSNSSVTIVWENFRRNLTEPSHLLNYEVSYKEAPQNVTPYDDRDPCGRDDWKVLDVPKMQDIHSFDDEPQWEEEKLINNLKYYTRYALYVKTVVIPDESSPNNNTGAESDVLYFVTLPDVPSSPLHLSLSSNSSSEVMISWWTPEHPNGELEEYKIYIKAATEDVGFQDRRNYCQEGRAETKITAPEQSTTKSFVDHITNPGRNVVTGENCCSCSAQTRLPKWKENDIQAETDMVNAIVDKVFIANPDAQFFIDSGDVNVTRRRRRRRAAGGGEPTDSEEKVFPGDSRTPEPSGRRPGVDFKLSTTVPANTTVRRYEFMLKNLTHFTRYTIGVIACRQKSTEIEKTENDTRICSEMKEDFIQTKPSPTADDIAANSIFVNVTGQKIRVRWEEPSNPNGVLLAYEIVVRRVDASKSNEPPHKKCITRKQFQEGKNNYTYPEKLHPGNYSFMIRTISLGAESNYTIEKYFLIEEGTEWSIGYIILIIVLPVLIIIILVIMLAFYYIRQKGIALGQVMSANPEYMQNVDIPEQWEVPRDKLEILAELGQGSFGMVYEGLLKDFIQGHTRMRCAVKTVAKDAPSEDRARFLQEALIMTQMNCHHVVKLLGVISKSQPTYVVMELMPHGDLKKYLRSRRPDPDYNRGEPPPTLKQTLRMAAEIADGMAYLDRCKLVHRDLAARNCMVAEDMTLKVVGDFGMTREIFETEYYRKATRGLLPVRWMAPESIRDGVFTSQSDLWSYGVVLWEMATLAAQPYQGLTNDQVLRYVRDGNVMERPENCPNELYELMTRCWAYEPRQRPTFTEILDLLVPALDTSFAQVSFYHSPEGVAYRAQAQCRPTQEDLITVQTPLRATFDPSDDDLDGYDSDDHDHDVLHSPYNCDSENGTLLQEKPCNGGLPRVVYSVPNATSSGNNVSTTVNNNRMQNSLQHTPSDFISLNLGDSSTDTNGQVTTTKSGGNNKSSSSSPVVAVKLPHCPSSGQISGKGVGGATTLNSPNNNCSSSNVVESSNALSIPYPTDGASKVGNGGPGSGSLSPTGPGGHISGTGVNGYVTLLRHSPVTETPKNNKTTKF